MSLVTMSGGVMAQTTVDENGNLQSAIDGANAGERIEFTGTFEQDLTVNEEITLIGDGTIVGDVTVSDSATLRGFTVDGTVTVDEPGAQLDDLTYLSDGVYSVDVNTNDVEIINSEFREGGGLDLNDVSDMSEVVVSGNTFLDTGEYMAVGANESLLDDNEFPDGVRYVNGAVLSPIKSFEIVSVETPDELIKSSDETWDYSVTLSMYDDSDNNDDEVEIQPVTLPGDDTRMVRINESDEEKTITGETSVDQGLTVETMALEKEYDEPVEYVDFVTDVTWMNSVESERGDILDFEITVTNEGNVEETTDVVVDGQEETTVSLTPGDEFSFDRSLDTRGTEGDLEMNITGEYLDEQITVTFDEDGTVGGIQTGARVGGLGDVGGALSFLDGEVMGIPYTAFVGVFGVILILVGIFGFSNRGDERYTQ